MPLETKFRTYGYDYGGFSITANNKVQFLFVVTVQAEKEARKKQKMQAFQQAKAKSKGLKNAKRWN